VGRRRGAKPRADGQELDRRRCRAGRAGKVPRSSRGQGSGGVNPAVVRGRIAFLPGEISPRARKGDGDEPEREGSRGRSSRGASTKDRRSGRSSPAALGVGATQMFTHVKLATLPVRVKPESAWQRGNQLRRARQLTRRPQPLQPPGADPHAGWCGRGRRGNPVPLSRFRARARQLALRGVSRPGDGAWA
jgi:hypothetical protein